ncbi:helix-turn-helix domain-containing protein [Oceanobacillus caeni]|uniref:helix-turn-helix domain-containing protein n=1 Tax=Oceanobacillus caeni TaxID=405946 RepID=UPI003636D44A
MEEGMRIERLFSEVIKSKRLEKGWSLKEVSIKTGINASYLNRLEKGERKNPSAIALFKISKSLDINIMFLIKVLLIEEEKRNMVKDCIN